MKIIFLLTTLLFLNACASTADRVPAEENASDQCVKLLKSLQRLEPNVILETAYIDPSPLALISLEAYSNVISSLSSYPIANSDTTINCNHIEGQLNEKALGYAKAFLARQSK